MLAPVRASISTPVLWCTVTAQRITAASPTSSMTILQLSSPSGWQNGMSSCVRFAPMTPATIAVSKTGPFAERRPCSRKASATCGGKRTVVSATAVRLTVVLSLTSTIVGRCSESKCENGMTLTADVIHFDFLGRMRAAAQFVALLAVAIGATHPSAPHQLRQIGVVDAAANRRSQVQALRREQTRIEFPLRRKPSAAAGGAKRL